MATLREMLARIPQMLVGTPQKDEALPTQVVEYSQATQDYMNPESMPTQLSLGTKTTPAKNGFLQDFMAGAKENYNNSFTPENLQPQNKNWATRLGEGVGTALRFGDSSLGRGLMAGGAALALGMSPGQALGYGLGTTAGRQGILTADKVYRNQLKKMGVTDAELDGVKGYITNDMFKNMSDLYKTRRNQTSWGELAEFDENIKRIVETNPHLADVYVPATVVKEILRGGLTDAQIINLLAKTDKTKAETGNINLKTGLLKEGKPTAVIEHKGKGSNRPTKPVDYKNKYGLE